MRPILERVRRTIRKAVPQAQESISYNIPTYKLRGKTLLHFAGWARHYSIYPANTRLREAFKDALAPYIVEKSTLRFSLERPVPVKLIERIAKFRENEIGKATPDTPRGR